MRGGSFRMRIVACLALLAALVSGCSSANSDGRDSTSRGEYGRGGVRGSGEPMQGGALGMLPASNWWHDSAMTANLQLSADQFAKLDALVADEDNVERLRRDSMAATREFRASVDSMSGAAAGSDDPLSGTIRRMEAIRGELLDHEVRLLVAERSILTSQQWTTLQEAMQQQRNGDRDGGGRRNGAGGRGGMGGGRGGRRGGMGGWQ